MYCKNKSTKTLSKRQARRQRGKQRQYLNKLAEQKIRQSYLWSAATWGGTKCPGCGIDVAEPRYLIHTNQSRFGSLGGYGIHITAFGNACEGGGAIKCPGENPDWESKCCS